MDNKPDGVLPPELLRQATNLCDEMDKLLAMQYHFYLAVEHSFPVKRIPYRNDLSLYPRFLHEKSVEVSDTLNKFQEALRDAVKK